MQKRSRGVSENVSSSAFPHDVWGKEKIPEDWKKGAVVKLPKKGDHRDCNILDMLV